MLSANAALLMSSLFRRARWLSLQLSRSKSVTQTAEKARANDLDVEQSLLHRRQLPESPCITTLLGQQQLQDQELAHINPGRAGGVGAGLACVGRGAEAAGQEPGIQQRRVDAQQVELRSERYGAIRLYPGPVGALNANHDNIVRA